jgi:pyridoxal 5'-phosphate synthase pdxT subunit
MVSLSASIPVTVGLLALQGAVAPHREKLLGLGAGVFDVRTPRDLENIRGIILPGGESTTMIHLLKLNRLWEPLREFTRTRPTWGICAGAILLAEKVNSPVQDSLKTLRISVERNAYGRQINSFIDTLTPTPFWLGKDSEEAVFIRAPRIELLGGETKPLFQWRNEIVMVQQAKILASTFHPELTESTTFHRYFLDLCRGNC